jgi:S1-C subfamily serine protease
MSDSLIALSDTLTARVAAAAPGLVTLYPGARAQRTGFAWQTDVVVTSEQNLPPDTEIPVMLPGGESSVATLLGRDPGTNVAVLKLTIGGPPLHDADPLVGGLAIALGGAEGDPTASLGMVHRVGPAWDSMAGGVIDRLIRLDLRLAAIAEGGPVLDASGALLGMSTFGPRRRVLVIPSSTVRRVIPDLLHGRAARGWLGLGLQPVGLPAAMQASAGRDAGLMVISLAPHGPADQAGVLPGDIVLDVDGAPAPHPRAIARALSGHRVGQVVPLRLLRGGAPIELSATIAERPAA